MQVHSVDTYQLWFFEQAAKLTLCFMFLSLSPVGEYSAANLPYGRDDQCPAKYRAPHVKQIGHIPAGLVFIPGIDTRATHQQ